MLGRLEKYIPCSDVYEGAPNPIENVEEWEAFKKEHLPDKEIQKPVYHGVKRAEPKKQDHVKIIITNHVIEVYSMQYPPSSPEKKDGVDSYSEHLQDYGLLARNPETIYDSLEDMRDKNALDRIMKNCRKEERRAQTLRDARNKCRRLAIANFNKDSYFMTLTVAENKDDVAFFDNEISKFLKKLKRRYGNYDYIAVREFQKRGAIHYHLLININFPLDVPPEYMPKKKRAWVGKYAQLSKQYNHEYIMPFEEHLKELWGHGFVDVEPCKHIDNVGAYLTKYMSKEFDDERLQRRKAYLNSQGLEQPKVITGIDAMKLLETLENKKEVFTNSYISEHLGKITYKEYNLYREN